MALLALIGAIIPAQLSAGERKALVIGNAAYTSGGELVNPVNDATDG